jgi:hypothetical protein
MKKKTVSSNSSKAKPRKHPSPETISRQINRLLREIEHEKSYNIKLMTYDQARSFCHSFIDAQVNAFVEHAEPFQIERYRTATKEIMLEILRDKYQMPNWDASLVLLHAGIELLELFDKDIDGWLKD